jgi:hypothetical protein
VLAPGVPAFTVHTVPSVQRIADHTHEYSSISHCTANLIYVFLEMKLGGLVPSSFIHVSVSELYIPRISLSIWLQQNRQINPENI